MNEKDLIKKWDEVLQIFPLKTNWLIPRDIHK